MAPRPHPVGGDRPAAAGTGVLDIEVAPALLFESLKSRNWPPGRGRGRRGRARWRTRCRGSDLVPQVAGLVALTVHGLGSAVTDLGDRIQACVVDRHGKEGIGEQHARAKDGVTSCSTKERSWGASSRRMGGAQGVGAQTVHLVGLSRDGVAAERPGAGELVGARVGAVITRRTIASVAATARAPLPPPSSLAESVVPPSAPGRQLAVAGVSATCAGGKGEGAECGAWDAQGPGCTERIAWDRKAYLN